MGIGLKTKYRRCVITAFLVGLAVCIAVIYANSLQNQFLWDDVTLVEGNRYIKDWKYLPNLFTEHIGAGTPNIMGDVESFYRPLQMLSYAVDYHFWRLNPAGYHITNVFMHIFTVYLLFWLLTLLFGDIVLSAIAVALFSVHPIHTEAVTYIAGRADVMAAFFLYASFIAYIYSLREKRAGLYGASLAAFLFALVCKEAVLVYPIVVFVYTSLLKKDRKIAVSRSIPFLAVTLVYVCVRATLLKFHAAELRGHSIDIFHRANGFFAALTQYIKLLFFPVGQHMEYGIRPFYFLEPAVAAGFGIFVALTAGIIYLKKKDAVLFFALFWFLVMLLPMSGLYPLNAYMAEHWLYIPSVGFFLAFGYLLIAGFRSRYRAISYGAMLICAASLMFYSSRTVVQNRYWKDAPTFFRETIARIDERSKPEMYYNLGLYYKKRGDLQEAAKNYSAALEINPRYFAAYNNLGTVYAMTGQYDKAIECYRRASILQPKNILFLANLGKTYFAAGRTTDARAVAAALVKMDPHHPATVDLMLILKKSSDG